MELKKLVERSEPPYLTKLITKISAQELSVRELRRLTKSPKKKETEKRTTYFKRTKQGFRLIGFSYRPEMPVEERQKAIQALEEALALLETELKFSKINQKQTAMSAKKRGGS